MKKLFTLTLAFLLVLTAFAGCTPAAPATQDAPASDQAPASSAAASKAPATEPVSISWAVFETDNLSADYYSKLISMFESDNPGIKIEKMLMTGDSRPQFLRTMMSAGNFPDVTVEAENITSVKGVFAQVPDTLLAKYDDAAVVSTFGTYNVIPAFKQYRMQVYYHKDLFQQAGITAIPQTWEEFAAVCQALKDNGQVPLMGAGAKDIWATGAPFWIGSANQVLINTYPSFNKDVKEGATLWSNEVLSDSLKKWQDLQKSGFYHKGSMSFGYGQAAEEFGKGSAAMMIDGSWAAAGFDAAGNTNMGAFPLPNAAGTKAYCAITSYWGISESSKNKEAAFTFAEYILGGNTEAYKTYLSADGWASTTKEIVEYDRGPLMNAFIANFKDFTLVPEITKTIGDYQVPSGFEDYINKSLQNVFTGKDVDQELAAWDKEFVKLQEAQQ